MLIRELEPRISYRKTSSNFPVAESDDEEDRSPDETFSESLNNKGQSRSKRRRVGREYTKNRRARPQIDYDPGLLNALNFPKIVSTCTERVLQSPPRVLLTHLLPPFRFKVAAITCCKIQSLRALLSQRQLYIRIARLSCRDRSFAAGDDRDGPYVRYDCIETRL